MKISRAEARRIALAAQGFGQRTPLLRAVDRLGVLQIDSVNIVVRAHYMPPFSRIGAYDRARLDAAAWGDGERALFEYWGHEASLLPVSMQPLFRWRMRRAERGEQVWRYIATFVRDRRSFAEAVLREIESRGALRASEIETTHAPKEKGGRWWSQSEAKIALEWLFWSGLVTTRTRKGFERVYDLPERVLPREVLATKTPSDDDAHRELLRIASRALGIATADDLRDYFRMRPADAKPRLPELVEDGSLEEVRVEGWASPAYLAKGARARSLEGVAALLAPFDPVVWNRARAHRLFDFHYRIEIYTPAAKRVHGYYVMPFLLADGLVARVDLKAVRDARVLEVRGAHAEGDAKRIALPLARALSAMAEWLDLDRVAIVSRRGPLVLALRKCG
jgi:uncharacterized protein YcaQ